MAEGLYLVALGLSFRSASIDRSYRFGEWLYEVMERAIQRLKDRTECFDDYFPCRKRGCMLEHVWRWLNLFHLFSQPETLQIIRGIEGVMEMA